jgi:cytochrome d ubiquinol oxidase subunit I
MKLAAAEGLQTTQTGALLALHALGHQRQGVFSIKVPNVLSILATNNPDGTVQGIDNIQAQEAGPVRRRRLHARSFRSRSGPSD